MKIEVLVCAHKEARLPSHPYFLPIQAGAALRSHIDGYQPDDEGENISARNPHFCELTCHYWAWKNLKDTSIVGLNHYRRYFDFKRQWAQFSADKHFVATDDFLSRPYFFPDLEETLHDYDIILPTRRHWRVSNTRQYGDYHIADDWETLRQIIKERSPQYTAAFEKTMDRGNTSSGYNMFITRWKLFDAYSEWLFDILFEIERRVPPTADPVQSRIYGYMSERLLNVFCEQQGLRIRYVPLIMPLDDYQAGCNVGNLHWCWRTMTNDMIFRFRRWVG